MKLTRIFLLVQPRQAKPTRHPSRHAFGYPNIRLSSSSCPNTVVKQDEYIPFPGRSEPSFQHSHLNLQYATAKVFGRHQLQIPVPVHGCIRHPLSRFLYFLWLWTNAVKIYYGHGYLCTTLSWSYSSLGARYTSYTSWNSRFDPHMILISIPSKLSIYWLARSSQPWYLITNTPLRRFALISMSITLM